MKYMLMMHAQDVLPAEDLQESMKYLVQLCDELVTSGELVSTEALVGPRQAKRVQANSNGTPEVTDGPFPEVKEYLLGFWIVDCDSDERAYEIAASISKLPGPDGNPANMPIEVRQIVAQSSSVF